MNEMKSVYENLWDTENSVLAEKVISITLTLQNKNALKGG
jgi:hypothetical protein